METEFLPKLGDLYATLAFCGLGFAVMVYLAVRAGQGKNADPRRRVLLPMLAYFGALLALMAFLGAFWSTFKYPPVVMTATTMTIGGERYPLPRLTNVRLESVGKGVNTTGRVLLLQTQDRKNWAFPDDRYEVTRMYSLLRDPK